jgi:hypothetical protein
LPSTSKPSIRIQAVMHIKHDGMKDFSCALCDAA